MSEGLNRVMLLGQLGADPELRHTQNGQCVLHLRLATTESYLDKDKVRRERTDWHSVVVWGKRGEALGKILSKGSSIFIEGSLRTSSYDNREGVKVYKTECVANNVILAGSGRGRAPSLEDDGFGAPPPEAPARGGGGGYQRNGAPPVAPPDDGFGAPPGSDEDIPFAYIGAARVSGDRVPRTWL